MYFTLSKVAKSRLRKKYGDPSSIEKHCICKHNANKHSLESPCCCLPCSICHGKGLTLEEMCVHSLEVNSKDYCAYMVLAKLTEGRREIRINNDSMNNLKLLEKALELAPPSSSKEIDTLNLLRLKVSMDWASSSTPVMFNNSPMNSDVASFMICDAMARYAAEGHLRDQPSSFGRPQTNAFAQDDETSTRFSDDANPRLQSMHKYLQQLVDENVISVEFAWAVHNGAHAEGNGNSENLNTTNNTDEALYQAFQSIYNLVSSEPSSDRETTLKNIYEGVYTIASQIERDIAGNSSSEEDFRNLRHMHCYHVYKALALVNLEGPYLPSSEEIKELQEGRFPSYPFALDAIEELQIYANKVTEGIAAYDHHYFLVMSIVLRRLSSNQLKHSNLCRKAFARLFKVKPRGLENLASDELDLHQELENANKNNADKAATRKQDKINMSLASNKWIKLKEEIKLNVPAMDELMRQIGLEEVKLKLVGLVENLTTSILHKKAGMMIDDRPCLNFILMGNPGCGKTMVSGIIASILQQLQLRPSNESDEIHRVKLQEALQDVADAEADEKKEETRVLREKLNEIKVEMSLKIAERHLRTVQESQLKANIVLPSDKSQDPSRSVVQTLQTQFKNDVDEAQRRVDQLRVAYEQFKEKAAEASEFQKAASAKSEELKQKIPSSPPERYISLTGLALRKGGADNFNGIVGKMIDTEYEKGGIIFIDEAPQLDPAQHRDGEEALQRLLYYSDPSYRQADLTFILAGYPDSMEKLIEYDPGLKRRFPAQYRIEIKDYDFAALGDIFLQKVPFFGEKPYGISVEDVDESKTFHLENKDYAYAFGRRLARGAGVRGFGNAGEVLMRLKTDIKERYNRRIRDLNITDPLDARLRCITATDVLGNRPDVATSAAFKELESMVGLQKVKETMRELIGTLQNVWDTEVNEPHLTPQRVPFLNRIFQGPPGTGKTTVGKLYAKMLKEFGFLSKGDLIDKKPQDFVGSFLGQSESKTNAILEQAKGNVLLIDEAYGLGADNQFYKAAVDAIVAMSPDQGGANMAIVLCGYANEMQEFIRNTNQGFARRFPPENTFTFEAYNESELRELLLLGAKRRNLHLPFPCLETLSKRLVKKSKMSNFGNAGAVNQLLDTVQDVAFKRANRESRSRRYADKVIVIPEDIQEAEGKPPFEGMDPVEAIVKYVHQIKCENDRNIRMRLPSQGLKHIVLVGNPGTGKTEMARNIGRLFYCEDLLPTDRVIETTAQSMQAGFVGQTSGKVMDLLKSALGGVLFIDEAHRITPTRGSFNEEVINQLLSALTSPEYKSSLVVVLAGYANDMDKMLQCDPGLRSRFSTRIVLPDITPKKAAQMLEKMALQLKLKFDEGILLRCVDTVNDVSDDNTDQELEVIAKEADNDELVTVESMFAGLRLRSGWANIRDVKDVMLPKLRSAVAVRIGSRPDKESGRVSRDFDNVERGDLVTVRRELYMDRPFLGNTQNDKPRDPLNGQQNEQMSDLFQFDASSSTSPSIPVSVATESATAAAIDVSLEASSASEGNDEEKVVVHQNLNPRPPPEIVTAFDDGCGILGYKDNLDAFKRGFKQGKGSETWQSLTSFILSNDAVKGLEATLPAGKTLTNQVEEALQYFLNLYEDDEVLKREEEERRQEIQRLEIALQSIQAAATTAQNTCDEEAARKALEEARKAEEAARARMTVVCGFCYRPADMPTSCGYGGYTPFRITVSL